MCFWRGRGPPLCTNKADRCRIGEISLMKDLTKTMEISMREMEEQEAAAAEAERAEAAAKDSAPAAATDAPAAAAADQTTGTTPAAADAAAGFAAVVDLSDCDREPFP